MKIGTLVTITLLLLCGFAGAQNTFCSANGPCTVTGAWSFTGPTTLPPLTLFRGRIDATTFAGADMCAKVNAAWTYAVGLGLGYGEVDATGFHGEQDVATNCFASFPANVTTPKVFTGLLRLAPDVKIVTSVTQNPPTNLIIDGGSGWVWPNASSADYSTLQGAAFIPSNTFDWASQKAVLTLGFATTGATGPRGIWLQNVGVDCIPPGGTYHSGSIGIYNGHSQENTGGDGVFVYNCTRGIELEADDTFGGSQNSGPWKRLNIQAPNVPNTETNWIGFDYCSDTNPAVAVCKTNRGIDGATFSGPGSVGSVAVSINSSDFKVRNTSVEYTQYAVELGRFHAAQGATLDSITGQGHSDFNMTAVVHSVSGSVTSFMATNISAASHPRTDYLIQDESTAGKSICNTASLTSGSPCFGATVSTPSLSFYSASFQTGYGNSRTVVWNSPAATSDMSISGNAASASTASLCPTCFASESTPPANTNWTLSNSDRFKFINMSPTAAAGVTATLPATIPDANWSATIMNTSNAFPVFINPNGINLNGSTQNWTLPPQASMTISTQGTSYHASTGWNGTNSLVNRPNALTFSQTTSTGDQNITCRVTSTICPAGMYRITLHVTVTAAGTAGTFQPYCAYTDASATVHNPVSATPLGLGTTSLTTIGNSYGGQCVVESSGAGNIKYGVTLTGATGTPTFRVNATAERISIQ
jgi:hypothetical protein